MANSSSLLIINQSEFSYIYRLFDTALLKGKCPGLVQGSLMLFPYPHAKVHTLGIETLSLYNISAHMDDVGYILI